MIARFNPSGDGLDRGIGIIELMFAGTTVDLRPGGCEMDNKFKATSEHILRKMPLDKLNELDQLLGEMNAPALARNAVREKMNSFER